MNLPASVAWRPLLATWMAGTALALMSAGAAAQASTPAVSASAPAAKPKHARTQAIAKKKKKGKQTAARDDDAPDTFVYGRRDDVMAFAAQVADDRGLDRAWVEEQLAKARYQPSVASESSTR